MIARLRAPLLITGVFLALLLGIQIISAAPAHSDRGAWAVGVVYATGDTVIYRNSIYLCTKANVSQALWTPDTLPGMWQVVHDNAVTSIYTDVGTSSIAAAYQASGQKYYALAFLMADSGGCQPAWDGSHSIPENYYAGEIQTIRAAGGDVSGVFGGAGRSDLASVCPTADQLQAVYQSVIDQYQFKWLDWMIDSSMLSDYGSLERRNQAVAALQANNPILKVSYTLPITRAGLAQPALDLLSNAKAKGVRIDYVNLLAMNYGAPTPDMGEAAERAAALAHNQLAGLGIASKVGITPLIGENSDPGEVFSVANADALVAFARANSYVGWLSFWSVGRDAGGCTSSTAAGASCSGIVQDNYAFTRRFESFP